jgi:Toprim-like
MDVQEELSQRFARAVDMPAFLGQQGFRLVDGQEPGRLCMGRAETGEVFRLEKDVERGGWTYANEMDPRDRGTVADFITHRNGGNRAACLERLAACADERGHRSPEGARYRAFLREMPEDLRRAVREHEHARSVEQAASRALDRLGVPPGTLDERRFGAVKHDADVRALAAEPEGLWASRYRPTDRAVVLVERPIDAIAYERAHGRQTVCYVATGSKPGDEQRKRLAHVLAEVPENVKVVLAFGRDEAGRRMAAEVQALAPMVRMDRHAPNLGARWADQMQLERRHAVSLQRRAPGLER